MFNKISSIIPQNTRTGNIDVSQERPVRAGAPSFGIPVARSRSTLPPEAQPEPMVEESVILESKTDGFFQKPNEPELEIEVSSDVEPRAKTISIYA